MKSLFENRLAPLTFSFGFIEAPLTTVGEALRKWRKQHQRGVELLSVSGSLEQLLLMLPPLTGLVRRELLIATKSSWIAYFDNLIKGGDPFPPVSYLCDLLKCRGITISCIPHTMTKEKEHRGIRATYGAVLFSLFAPDKTEFLNFERAIAAANDGGRWVFRQSGKMQPFERPECYQAKKISDRFTDEMLEDYCSALGVRLFEPAFYGPNGSLVNVSDPLPNNHSGWALAEAQNYHGLNAFTRR
jgi:hypothetical protein